jgi:hypothetical protein
MGSPYHVADRVYRVVEYCSLQFAEKKETLDCDDVTLNCKEVKECATSMIAHKTKRKKRKV